MTSSTPDWRRLQYPRKRRSSVVQLPWFNFCLIREIRKIRGFLLSFRLRWLSAPLRLRVSALIARRGRCKLADVISSLPGSRKSIMNNYTAKIFAAWLVAACLCVSSGSLAAQQTPPTAKSKAKAGKSAKSARGGAKGRERQSEVAPTFADVSYGPHASNQLDFWQAKSSTPAPLVVFIHGGGFRAGDKADYNAALLKACLDARISYASLNYRLSDVAPYPAAMHDSARAIQFLRSKAADWNIDAKRLACTGGSAGAGISQWLAFHDDLADPASTDPVARQSTRLSCTLPTNMQCTYDPREIKKIVPGKAYDIAPLKTFQGLPTTFNWDQDPINPELDARLRDCSPLTHLTKDDPPIFAMNNPGSEKPGNIHHPNFGRHLKQEMDKIGVPCEFHLTTEFADQAATAAAMLAFLKKCFAAL
jgi:acetyl esterase/lipase